MIAQRSEILPLSLKLSCKFYLSSITACQSLLNCFASFSIQHTCSQPSERAKVTFKKRIDIAKEELEVGPTCHITNGDEEDVPDFAGQFHKSLPHDKNGQVRHVRVCSSSLSL